MMYIRKKERAMEAGEWSDAPMQICTQGQLHLIIDFIFCQWPSLLFLAHWLRLKIYFNLKYLKLKLGYTHCLNYSAVSPCNIKQKWCYIKSSWIINHVNSPLLVKWWQIISMYQVNLYLNRYDKEIMHRQEKIICTFAPSSIQIECIWKQAYTSYTWLTINTRKRVNVLSTPDSKRGRMSSTYLNLNC